MNRSTKNYWNIKYPKANVAGSKRNGISNLIIYAVVPLFSKTFIKFFKAWLRTKISLIFFFCADFGLFSWQHEWQFSLFFFFFLFRRVARKSNKVDSTFLVELFYMDRSQEYTLCFFFFLRICFLNPKNQVAHFIIFHFLLPTLFLFVMIFGWDGSYRIDWDRWKGEKAG